MAPWSASKHVGPGGIPRLPPSDPAFGPEKLASSHRRFGVRTNAAASGDTHPPSRRFPKKASKDPAPVPRTPAPRLPGRSVGHLGPADGSRGRNPSPHLANGPPKETHQPSYGPGPLRHAVVLHEEDQPLGPDGASPEGGLPPPEPTGAPESVPPSPADGPGSRRNPAFHTAPGKCRRIPLCRR